MVKKTTTIASVSTPIISGDLDIRVNEKLRVSAKFREIWEKEAPGAGADESEIDLTLCNFLADIYEGNYEAIDTAFQMSPVF